MSTRPRHQDKDIEKFLQMLEDAEWDVIKGKGYFKAYCSCEEKHKATVHLTPSGRNYLKNRASSIKRDTCWEGPT